MRVCVLVLFAELWGLVAAAAAATPNPTAAAPNATAAAPNATAAATTAATTPSPEACPPPPPIPNGAVSEATRKQAYREGDVIHFVCGTGFISGLTIRYRCSNHTWEALHAGSCYLKPCPLPEETPYGFYKLIRGEDFVFGSTVKYFCKDGYRMVSKHDTRMCMLDNWSHHLPVCEPMTCDPPPAVGGLVIQNLPQNEEVILPHRFLRFSCDGPRKRLNGSSVLICGEDGRWDYPVPTCEDIACKVEEMHPDLRVRGRPPTNRTLEIGYQLQFYCRGDSTLEGAVEVECLPTGQWSSPFPRCFGMCNIQNIPKNLVYGPTSWWIVKGQKLKFSCLYRQQFLRGAAEVQCEGDGQWSHPFPTCGSPNPCGKPPYLLDGDIKYSTQPSYQHGNRVQYVCQMYYVMEGGPYKTCNDGEWKGAIRCIKPCIVNEEILDSHNVQFTHVYADKMYSKHNDVIEFSCRRRTRPTSRVAMRQRCVEGVITVPICQ